MNPVPTYQLTQNNFYDIRTVKSFKHQLWQVPISIEYGFDSGVHVEDLDLMTTPNQTITISRKSSLSDFDGSYITRIAGECYMFNHNMSRLYRIFYDSMLYDRNDMN